MNTQGSQSENHGTVNFSESECSDGMCCFTCVIPPDNGHLGFFRSFWKRGTGSPHVKLLVTCEGYKDELYDSCKFLNFIISRDEKDSKLKMDLRCSIYKNRPKQCMDYPDRAGESMYYKMSGPCIFNEYAAPSAYKKLVYKRDWQAFYAIRDSEEAIRNIVVYENTPTAREMLLNAQDVHRAAISIGNAESDFILIPIPRQTCKILYVSDKHVPISTIRQAYYTWEGKIEKNLQNHYGPEWETRLKHAIEMEENDARKRCDENPTGNLER
jgi:hypothetical protein